MDKKSGHVDDEVFFGPITEREKKARQLFQQRFGSKEPELSILYNMNDYMLNDSQSRQSMSLLGEIEPPEKAALVLDEIPECTEENISLVDSFQEELCNDFKNVNMNRPKYETHPGNSYINIDPNYSLVSEPEPRIFPNFEPQSDGLSLLSQTAYIHSSRDSKSSDGEVYSIDSSKFPPKLTNSGVETLNETDTIISKRESTKFNDTLEAIEELLSRQNQKETLTYLDTTTNLSNSQEAIRQTSLVNRTPCKHEQNVSNSKHIENSDLILETNYNSHFNANKEFLSGKNEEIKSHIYPDSTNTLLDSEQIRKNLKSPNQDRHFNIKNTRYLHIPEIKRETDYSPDEFLSEKLITSTSSSSTTSTSMTSSKISLSSTRSTPSLTCNIKSNSSRIPRNMLSKGKEILKSKQQSTNTITPNKILTPCKGPSLQFKTPTQPSAQKQTNRFRKFGHIISPVAAYINKPSPRLIQNVKCEKSLSERKLRIPMEEQKENLHTNDDVSIQFPNVDYKKGSTLFMEEKIKSRLPNHLSPRMQNVLQESSPISCKHLGHIRVGDKEFSLVLREN